MTSSIVQYVKTARSRSRARTPPRDRFLGKYVQIKDVVNDLKGLFLESYDNLEQSWITFKLLEPSHALAKRAARSAASASK